LTPTLPKHFITAPSRLFTSKTPKMPASTSAAPANSACRRPILW